MLFINLILHSKWVEAIGITVIFFILNFFVHHSCFKGCDKQ